MEMYSNHGKIIMVYGKKKQWKLSEKSTLDSLIGALWADDDIRRNRQADSREKGTDGSLTGYAGGIDKKEWLLALEKETYK